MKNLKEYICESFDFIDFREKGGIYVKKNKKLKPVEAAYYALICMDENGQGNICIPHNTLNYDGIYIDCFPYRKTHIVNYGYYIENSTGKRLLQARFKDKEEKYRSDHKNYIEITTKDIYEALKLIYKENKVDVWEVRKRSVKYPCVHGIQCTIKGKKPFWSDCALAYTIGCIEDIIKF